MQNIPSVFDITVSGGTGTITLDGTANKQIIGGDAIAFGVLAEDADPITGSNYSIDIKDSDGFGVMGVADVTGDVNVEQEAQFYGSDHVITIVGDDGDYRVKVWFKET